jgi:hypothetical protein
VPPAKLFVNPFSSFPEKKQKRLFCFAEVLGCPNIGEADPGGYYGWLFPTLFASFSGKRRALPM